MYIRAYTYFCTSLSLIDMCIVFYTYVPTAVSSCATIRTVNAAWPLAGLLNKMTISTCWPSVTTYLVSSNLSVSSGGKRDGRDIFQWIYYLWWRYPLYIKMVIMHMWIYVYTVEPNDITITSPGWSLSIMFTRTRPGLRKTLASDKRLSSALKNSWSSSKLSSTIGMGTVSCWVKALNAREIVVGVKSLDPVDHKTHLKIRKTVS